MTMVVHDKQRLYYRFEGEKGAYLLLHHGLFGSHQDWFDAGYVDALRNEFRLIVMDARGHGRSDHPLEPDAYRLQAMADDVVAIMDELDIRNLHFCGYSLGALVGFELLMRHPERVRIVMLAGESPFVSETMQAEWHSLADAIRADGLAPVRERLGAEQRIATTQAELEQEGEQAAALALLESLASEPMRPDEGRISVDSPVALFTGEDDPALDRMRDARRRIHRARFVSFPGRTHAGLFREREPLIAEMLRLLRPGRRTGESEGNEPTREERSSHGGRGRGRGSRGREEPPRARAPLTPPPPVEVPGETLTRAESAAAPPPPEQSHPAPSAAAEAAHRPAELVGGAEPGVTVTVEPADHAPSQEAPDDLGVRARQEEQTPPEPESPEAADWSDPAALAPDTPKHTARTPGSVEPDDATDDMTDEDDGEDWPELDEDPSERD
ncbi:MAG TPA: alpha/beta fold hydrolase [bacterium]|nr:alpha/beta fold hydrolase [bacterium]